MDDTGALNGWSDQSKLLYVRRVGDYVLRAAKDAGDENWHWEVTGFDPTIAGGSGRTLSAGRANSLQAAMTTATARLEQKVAGELADIRRELAQ